MIFVRGTGTLNQEVARLQFWAEEKSRILDGRNGDDGMIRDWQDGMAERRQMHKIVRTLGIVLVFICGVPAVLVSLSALGIIHLR